MYQYPYGNAQQLNLDWLMEQWQVVKENIDGSLQGEIDRVEAAITDLLAARDAAVAAAGAANTSAGAAAQSAQAAAADAATASAQAAAATQERVNAAQAANNAQSYAGTAQTQAAAAQNAAGQAAASASQAAADASDAHDDAVAASGSAMNAAASAAGALQNFQLSDAARQAAQAAEQDAEAAATLLQPPATSADIGKALIVKTVGGGTVTAYELGESGGGGASAIVKTIEDVPIASFDDGTASAVKQIVVGIEPKQSGSGDPAPDNVRPITGWTGAKIEKTGKNLLPKFVAATNNYGLTVTVNDDGSITVTGTANATTTIALTQRNNLSVPIIINADNPLTYSTGAILTGKIRFLTDSFGLDINAGSTNITTYTNGKITYVVIYFNATENETYNFTIYPQFEYGPSYAGYEAYNGTIYSITFPTEAGTVFSGELDVTNKKLYVNTYRKINALSWEYTTQYSRFLSVSIKNTIKKPTSISTVLDGLMCSCYTARAAVHTGSQPINYTIGVNSFGEILIRDENYTSVSDWLNAVGNEIIVYPLEIPLEYDITTSEVIQLLSGYNNVWADTGNINLLQYYADSKKYINEQDNLVKALIAPVLDGMVADTALTANDFRIVDNTLYRITAPVAAGAALTPNTNCTATTIGAILKTLLT